MKSKAKKYLPVIALILFMQNNIVYSQEDESPLSAYNNYLNKIWVGHFVDSEDSALVHQISWEPILKGNAIKEIKRVPGLSFVMETYIYLNYESGKMEFLSLVSKNMISKGSVKVDGNKLVYEGTNYFDSGTNQFKKTFEINPSGELEDYFYRMKEGIYSLGHLIKYKATE